MVTTHTTPTTTPFVQINGSGDIRTLIPERAQREAIGKGLRDLVPRSSLGRWEPAPGRPDAVDVVRARNRGRQQRLVPLRIGRMLASPFTFYRGSADLMAIDLRHTPSTGLVVQLCGDAHLSNFGLYASPERRLVTDINDFDETTRGRWEWDLERLVASIELCGRDNGLDRDLREEAIARASLTYRDFLRGVAGLPRLEVHYVAFAASGDLPPHWCDEMRDIVKRENERARRRTHEQVGVKLTADGGGRFRVDPPVVTSPDGRVRDAVIASLDAYIATVTPDIQELLKDYGILDVAHKVVGVGSVGTRDYIVLLQGNHEGDHLFLQVKEALPSVVRDPKLASHRHHGEHVVVGQRRIQSVSDPFLGWTNVGTRPYYVRQLRDMKGGVHPERLKGRSLVDYGELCGLILGKAHARTGYPAVIAAYLGGNDRFDRAMVSFARAYADQVERDHAELMKAVEQGSMPAETGI